MCIDGYQRSCVIRGKFLGKGKRDNILSKGKWILVGLRDWENSNKGNEKEKCDLLEVYSDMDKQRLQNDNTIDFSGFLKNEQIENELDDSIKFTNESNDDDLFFSDDENDEQLQNGQEEEEKSNSKIDVKTINDQLNKVDIDDI